jgi:hypothetical protein
VSFTITTSDFFCFPGSFLAMNSLEYKLVRLLVACTRETLVHEWDSLCTESSEGVHSLGWEGQ